MSAGIGAAALLLYLWLSPDCPGIKDSPEFTLSLGALGVAHPTGYPLYTLFGHAFVLALRALGAGWGYAANAWSAAGAAVAIGLLHALAARAPGPGTGATTRLRAALALAPVALLAFNPMWVRDATLAEIHSWHVAWTCGAALLFLSISRGGAGARAALAWGLVCGLGAAHHATSLLTSLALSAVLLFQLGARKALRLPMLPAFLAGAALPLLAYALVFARAAHPSAADWPLLLPGVSGALSHIRAEGYTVYLGSWHPSAYQSAYLGTYIFPLLVPAGALLALSIPAAPGATERGVRAGLALSAAAAVAYTFQYGVPDPVDYFLPPLALALVALPLWVAPALARARHAGLRVGAGLLMAAGCAGWGVAGIRESAGTRDAVAGYERELHGLWASIPDSAGIVLWPDDMFHLLRVYQQLGREKPALGVYNPNELTREPVRTAFARRYGIDALRGIDPGRLADSLPSGFYIGDADPVAGHAVAALTWNVAQQSPVPVYGFMPQKSLVRRFPPRLPPSRPSD